jgi:hypothetical protein
MPEDNDKYANPQKVLADFEFHVAINRKLKRKDLTKKERRILKKEAFRSYEQAEKEFHKPLPPLNPSYRERNKLLFEPYRSYFEELIWDLRYYQKPIINPVMIALRRSIYGSPLHQKLNDTLRMFRIHNKKIQLIKKLKFLELSNEQEAEERDMGLMFQISDSYLISKYSSQRIKGFELSIKHGKVTVKRPNLNALEAQMCIYSLIRLTLERTVLISASLKDKSLSEEKRNEYIKKREKLRENLKFVMTYEIRRERQNGENFKNFTEECSKANDNLIKFMDLYLRSLKELLKSSPNVKTDVTMEELIDLSKLLKRSDLTIEERKYFRHRKDLIEKDIDWEGTMKKLLADFPYEKDRYFPKID